MGGQRPDVHRTVGKWHTGDYYFVPSILSLLISKAIVILIPFYWPIRSLLLEIKCVFEQDLLIANYSFLVAIDCLVRILVVSDA